MWKPFKFKFTCRLFRDHDYQLRREPAALFLECKRCGHRSHGWNLAERRVRRADSTLRLLMADSGEAARAVRSAGTHSDTWVPLKDAGELRLTFDRED
jgi:hypothetical protein